MRKHLLLIALALVVAPLMAAGCVSPSSPSPSPGAASSTATSAATNIPAAASVAPSGATTASQQPYSVSIVSYAFQPSTMTVPRGATVMWRNDASITHTVTSNTGAFSSGNLSPGMTFTHQFNQAGTYQYHCSIHPSMMGTITVQ